MSEGDNETSYQNSNRPTIYSDHTISLPSHDFDHIRLLQPPIPHRYAGDGLDLRRPIMSTLSSNIIDLTGEPDSPPESRDSTGTDSTLSRAHRPPRFARNIIDLEAETSPDIEVLGSGPSHVANRLQAGAQDVHRHTRTEGVAQFVPTLRPVTAARSTVGIDTTERRLGGGGADPHLWQYLTNMIRNTGMRTRTFELPGPTAILDLDEWHAFDVPVNAGQYGRQMYRNRENVDLVNDAAFNVGNNGFQPPTLDFENPAFQIGERASTQPQGYTYEPPGPARDGYSRSPEEDEEVVCPNCDEELGVGNTDLKRQVWVVKSCGHVRLCTLVLLQKCLLTSFSGILWRVRKASSEVKSSSASPYKGSGLFKMCSRWLWQDTHQQSESNVPDLSMKLKGTGAYDTHALMFAQLIRIAFGVFKGICIHTGELHTGAVIP